MVTLFRIAPRWKQSKCPSTRERLHKPGDIYTTGKYSGVKRNEPWMCITTWVTLQRITLREKSQCHKVTHFMIPFVKRS